MGRGGGGGGLQSKLSGNVENVEKKGASPGSSINIKKYIYLRTKHLFKNI